MSGQQLPQQPGADVLTGSGHAYPAESVAAGSPLLEVTDLRVRFRQRGRGDVQAVNGVSYTLQSGRTLAIAGESGSGKTVSSRAVMGLLPDTATVTGSVPV